ncbi:hypothetical protein APY04_0832 [Hyphomicrobium sulfonivorans]|uniref:Uncharacterized protein n=1 Tax=Hyphomicrobium sulfonivorans TaxID=121290 RepID=A0A109BLB5_HYPSL|nr:hypothetical protein [Hyphomicrobium sulfonivorans]KWT70771.1 hypothetical protein APY04_0832 [Hyphomicrobium sulfonivorans]
MLAVFRDAAQTVANEVRKPEGAGGNMPVDTGNLRRSLAASTDSMPQVQPGVATFSDNDSQITAVISNAPLGSTIYLGFQADYAVHMEYGTGPHMIYPKDKQALHFTIGGAGIFAKSVKHPGTTAKAFVRTTAQRWPQIVKGSAEKIKGRVEMRAKGR